jgi:rubrerythrin
MPSPLNPRLFYSKQAVDEYNAAVAAYLAQQADTEYNHAKNQKRNKRHNRNDY